MWKSFFKILINLYFCLFVYVVFSVGSDTKYGGAAAYVSEPRTYALGGHILSVYLYIVLLFFPAYLAIPAMYHLIVYRFKIQSLWALVIGAGITGSIGAFVFLALRLMRSNFWLIDIIGLGVTGVLYGLIDGLWVRKKN
ncbi:hypothetical protein [Siphonobacter sp. SORGH_AS_0500]|uniref:hypothetical protein n=1 Tax=Siphonobacter sp. SORGH_AS_0500 TaxID=1864824 RepID=UPI002864D4C0|nr:hypothetical protein [Siphonobacter sp. SORGH_AS_0500]MDR6193780.1 hypothetical protein [Siphonobacter sp. SORGH_AS_0500]